MDSRVNQVHGAQMIHTVSVQASEEKKQATKRGDEARVSMRSLDNAAELIISKEGHDLAAKLVEGNIKDLETARQAIHTVKQALQEKPELTKELHSNLRAMRINQLTYND